MSDADDGDRVGDVVGNDDKVRGVPIRFPIDPATRARMDAALAAYARDTRETIRQAVAASTSWQQAQKRMVEQASQILSTYDGTVLRQQVASWIEISDRNRRALSHIAARIQSWLPSNWDGVTDYLALADIALDDGLPIVWTPPAPVLQEILSAPDRASRVSVLRRHEAEIIDACRALLAEVTNVDLLTRVPVALQSFYALEAGLTAPAQALAVSMSESLIREEFGAYRKVVKSIDEESVEDLSIVDLRRVYTLLPVKRFYEEWRAEEGLPAPTHLSRHATVHHARADHLTPENALLSVMLLTSLIRTVEAES